MPVGPSRRSLMMEKWVRSRGGGGLHTISDGPLSLVSLASMVYLLSDGALCEEEGIGEGNENAPDE